MRERNDHRVPTVGRTSLKHAHLLVVLAAWLCPVGPRAVAATPLEAGAPSARLVAPGAERAVLPAELADRNLPLDALHQQLAGAGLDRARAYVGLYAQGESLGEGWGEGAGLKEALHDAWSEARGQRAAQADVAMIVIPTDLRRIDINAISRTFTNANRGVLGVLVESGDERFRVSPTYLVAKNYTVEGALKREAERRGLSYHAWIRPSRVWSLPARQFHVPLRTRNPAIETLRGNVLVQPAEVTQASVRNFEKLLTDWMFNNLAADGRLTYSYFPSAGREGRGNNMVRQWMGSVAMGRAVRAHPDAGRAAAAEKNLRYNLQQFYRTDGELGYIEYNDEANLGAAALALMALAESPKRAEFAEQERGLLATTRHLWQPNGRFLTFLKPASRQDDNQNFYPGETLLAWSLLGVPDLLDESLKSVAYYRTWHLRNRNPAFIPWHTQACYRLYLETRDRECRDWIFEMNDWLVEVMQDNSRVEYDDTLGQFHEPTSERFGPPHASSTGVYLEGLIDAFVLARSAGDEARRERYRKSIILGLRSGMQLQFQDEIDLYYVAEHQRVRGGVRTSVYNNEIRVDNVQHFLMAVQKILREFTAENFEYPAGP
jgi:hypothetical protein